MLKKLVFLFSLVMCNLSAFALEFYVSPDGCDHWSGRLPKPNATKTDGPFMTLKRARNAIRELKGDEPLQEPVTVMLRGGKYYLQDPLRLGPKDSGTKENPVSYTAYPNEEPILSGGKPITKWQPYQGQILQCRLPEAMGGKWRFRQLFLDGERQTRSRYPNLDPQSERWNGKWAISEQDDVALEEEYIVWKEADAFPHEWSKPTEGEIFLLPRKFLWGDSAMIRIRSIDPDRGIIHLEHGMRDFDLNPHFYAKEKIRPDDCQFIVENLLEELDQPGEWCLDGEEGVLYFWPPKQAVMETAEVVAPVTKCLVRMHGAKNIHISGLTFTETRGGEPTSHYLDVEGTGAQQGRMDWEYCGETIYLSKCQNCVIENNRLSMIGGNGVYLRHHNRENLIRGNEICDAGANAVVMEGSEFDLWSDESIPPYPEANEITDNDIHHCGVYDTYAAGISLGLCKDNWIAHNHLHDLPHHAINLGNNRLSKNTVEYNRIEHVCYITHDNGAINCWHELPRDVEPPGHVFRYNLITDCGGKGIYLDNFSSNCLVYGNIVVNVGTERGNGIAIFVRGRGNTIENNILVGDQKTVYIVTLLCAEGDIIFRNNVVYDCGDVKQGWLDLNLQPNARKVLTECDNNVYFSPHINDPLMTDKLAFSQWRDRFRSSPEAYDVHSVVADPLFIDLAGGDYRLRPESPIFQLGFMPIDVDKIGPRK